MSNNLLYGGIIYPDNSFVFDKIYNSFKEASENVNTDTVLVGRYILIVYCNTAFSKDERNRIESNWGSITSPTDEEYAYHVNFLEDEEISKDRKVYRKIYKDGQYAYQEVISLHSDLSDASIAVLGISENEKILAVDNNRTLSSTLDLVYEGNNKLVLKGRNGGQVNSSNISTSEIFSDRIKSNDNILFYKDNKLQTNMSLKPIENGFKLVTTNDGEQDIADMPLSIVYDSSDQHIKIKSGETVISKFNASDFVKDSFLREVKYNGNNELVFTFTTYDITTGTYQDKDTLVALDIMDAGNGIEINGNTIKAKTSGNYLTVDNTGIHTTQALENAITTAKEEAIEEAQNTVKVVTNENEKGTGNNTGDVCIVKTPIDDNHNSYTAYVWDDSSSEWKAMDGNYNANNIYFDENIMVTKEIGYITLTNGNGTIPSKGKNLVEVFDSMFSKELNPSKTEPSINISLNKAGSYEVGTTVTGITCSVSFNDGAYSYGPEPTGVTVNSWEIKDSKNQNYDYSSIINISDILITDDINYTVTAKANHTAGKTPKTNKGNDCEDSTKKIAADIKQNTSSAITGYRWGFAGGTNATTIDSSIVRGIMNAKKNSKDAMDTQNEALEFTAHKGDTKVFFAYPATWSGTPYFEILGLAWSEATGFKAESNIEVADARGNNGYTEYKLYVWEPGGGALTADETKFRVWFI